MNRATYTLASFALSRPFLSGSHSAAVLRPTRLLTSRFFSSSSRSQSQSPSSLRLRPSIGVVGGIIFAAGVASYCGDQVYAKELARSPEYMPKEVVLYQYEACPFCNKVKAFLDYYDVPYQIVEVNPLSRKEIKWSDYKKVPILMVDGEQMNDSSVIIDKLSSMMNSDTSVKEVSYNDEEKHWRCWVDNHLVHMLSPNIYRNTSEALESFDYITSNGNFGFTEKITVKYAGAAAMYFVSKNLKKKYNITDERAALYEAAEQWVEALNGREFLGPRRIQFSTFVIALAYADAGTLNQNYANILLMLLRLRQACDHPLLVTGLSSDSIGRDSMLMGKNLPKNMLINLMKHLDTSSAICCVCNDPPEDAIVTMCGHVFCYQCVSEYLRGDDNTCPSPECKELLGPDVIFSEATLRSCLYGNDHPDVSAQSEPKNSSVLQKGYSSSKIKAVMEILKSHCKSNSACSQLHGIVGHSDISSSRGKETSEIVGSVVKVTNAIAWSEVHTEAPKKAIVFSQWTGMLDLVEISLNQSDLRYRRLDGTMTLSARDKAVKEFNNDPEVTVMLMSLKAGNLGLNMVAATHVVLLDLWWNPTTEDQAIDRAHRIGQTQPVTVSRLTVKETVEERILALQEEKRKMVASAFGEDQSGGSGTRLTVEDLRFLFMGKQ